MKVKNLIALLQKEDPEAVVIKYKDGGTIVTTSVEGLSPVAVKSRQHVEGEPPPILIE